MSRDPLPGTTDRQGARQEQIVLAYLLDAVKYLIREDPGTARRSWEHAEHHFRKFFLPERPRNGE